jgi:hypothetical protein
MFKDLGLSRKEAIGRLILLGSCLAWAGGPKSTDPKGLHEVLRMEELLQVGVLKQEELFDGDQAHETAMLCYSSGTTGKL